MTTRGMKEAEMIQVAQWMVQALRNSADAAKLRALHEEVKVLCAKFPVPGLN
jgi:glycine hydroxymethyltransferase